MTANIERLLWKRGITIVPDFVANAGGVIGSWVEWKGKKEKTAFKEIKSRIHKNKLKVLKASEKEHVTPREAAMDLAKNRILGAHRKFPATCI